MAFTVAHLIDSFHANTRVLVRAGTVEPATAAWYESQLKKLDPYRDLPADTLRIWHLSAVEFTNAFVRGLKRLFRWAADEDLIPKDPFGKLPIPPCGERTRVLDRPELRRLYLASPRAVRRLLFVQLNTVARPGEVRNLTWGQVDWDRRCIVLFKFKGKNRRRVKARARLIPLPPVVVRMLRNLLRKAADPSADGRVFIATRGRPWTPNGVRCAMRVARVRAGLDGGGERVVCYTLRHTGATNLSRAGCDLKHLAEIMGHTRTTTTERYLHLNADDMHRAIDRAGGRGG